MKHIAFAICMVFVPAAFAADCSPASAPSAIFETGSTNGWEITTLPPAEQCAGFEPIDFVAQCIDQRSVQ